jgi:hypothetical protein
VEAALTGVQFFAPHLVKADKYETFSSRLADFKAATGSTDLESTTSDWWELFPTCLHNLVDCGTDAFDCRWCRSAPSVDLSNERLFDILHRYDALRLLEGQRLVVSERLKQLLTEQRWTIGFMF